VINIYFIKKFPSPFKERVRERLYMKSSLILLRSMLLIPKGEGTLNMNLIIN